MNPNRKPSKNSTLKFLHLKTVKEVFEHVSNNMLGLDNNLGFRGQGNSEWSLESTFVRFCQSISVNEPEQRLLTLQKLEKVFKENLIVNGDLSQAAIDKVCVFEYGQHFGLPTPLIDWSYSPYVALFFALSEQHPDGKSAEKNTMSKTTRSLWVINEDIVERYNEDIISIIWDRKKSILDEELLKEQYSPLDVIHGINEYNRRLPFQQGFFTQHTYYNSLNIWLERIDRELPHKYPEPLLTQINFECTENERNHYLRILDKMNINYRTLFPDITGSVLGAIESIRQETQRLPTKIYVSSLK
jgi:hypothetical protein